MNCLLLVLGGAADRFRRQLDGKTPLAVARTPALDDLALGGKVGRVRTIPRGLVPSLETSLQTILGSAPDVLAIGGGPFEAIGLGLEVEAGDVAYRLSLATTLDGALVDPTAGGIGTPEAGVLLEALAESLDAPEIVFGTGRGHAHVLVLRGRAEVAVTTAPTAIVGKAMEPHLPEGTEGAYLRGIMERAHAVLAEHEVNRIRVDLGENPADTIWPHGGGRPAALPSVPERVGGDVAAFFDEPLVGGLLERAGVSVRGAPSLAAVTAALEQCDLVVVHAAGPARARPVDGVGARVRAIETLDRDLVGPLADLLADLGPHRLLVVADHAPGDADETPPVPFLLAGEGVASVRRFPFDEKGAAASDLAIDEGHLLLEHLLAHRTGPPPG